MRAVLILVVSAVSAGCAAPSAVVGHATGGAAIVEIRLSLSNCYLLKSKTPILVDTGSEGDMDDLAAALAANGVAPKDLALVIVTHGHADHAGLAADLRRRSNARVVLGAGDLELARTGHNDELRPTGFTARLLKLTLSQTYPEFTPTIALAGSDQLDLAPWGIEGKVVAMPGHTEGSLVVLLADKSAFVGDMILGGYLGGALRAHSPGEHYFHADPRRNRRNIEDLVKLGVQTFYLGHGGPVYRDDVIEAFEISDPRRL